LPKHVQKTKNGGTMKKSIVLIGILGLITGNSTAQVGINSKLTNKPNVVASHKKKFLELLQQ
jgi:hypothetical protein